MLNRRMVKVFVVAALALVAAPQARAQGKYPRMVAALGQLKEARIERKEAAHDFGGHRARALSALDEAIEQMDRALRAVDVNPRFVPPDRDVYKPYRNHPHIR